MKTLLKSSIAFLLLLVPVLAFGQQVLQIMNVGARQITSLDGQWKTIVDPFENGYYDYRLKPYDAVMPKTRLILIRPNFKSMILKRINCCLFPVTGIHNGLSCTIMKALCGIESILNTPCNRANVFSSTLELLIMKPLYG